MDGAIIVNAGCTKLAYANVQLMPDPTIAVERDGHAAPHRRARRQADGRARDLDLAAARDGDGLRRPEPLPARADRRRAREDEPGARDARDLPRPARAGADAADGARVPERGHARRRARRPAARRADDAHGRGDRAGLRRARRGGTADPDAARGARRRRADEKAALVYDYHAEGGAARTQEGLEALAGLPYNQLLEFELLAVLGYPATSTRSTIRSRRAATASSRTSRGSPTAWSSAWSRAWTAWTGSSGSQRELEAVEGVGTVRAREIREGLRRLQEHNLVDRYLQI